LAKATEIVVSEFSDTKKPNKVFVDYTRTRMEKPWLFLWLRATSDATVSTPLEWKEVKKELKPESLNLFSVVKLDKDPGRDFGNDRNWRLSEDWKETQNRDCCEAGS